MAAILSKSRANNPRDGVTGALCLLQRGRLSSRCSRAAATRSAGATTASRQDARHPTSRCCSYEEIGERRFAGWSMGQVNMARLNPALMLKYSESAVLDPYAVSGQASLALFNELVATASIGVQA